MLCISRLGSFTFLEFLKPYISYIYCFIAQVAQETHVETDRRASVSAAARQFDYNLKSEINTVVSTLPFLVPTVDAAPLSLL